MKLHTSTEKKGQTFNTLIIADGRGIPIAIDYIISGNYNDLYNIIPQLLNITKAVYDKGTVIKNSILNAYNGIYSKAFRRFFRRRKILPNVKENIRNRKKGRIREFMIRLIKEG